MWQAIYHEFRRWAKGSNLVVVAYKRTDITMETDRVWIIRKARSTRAWCAECGREVDMVGVKEAEALSGMTPQLLSGGEGGRGWHSGQAANGSALICVGSVLKSMS